MKSLLGAMSISILTMVYFVGCSENTFSLKPSEACEDFKGQHEGAICGQNDDGETEFSYTVKTGEVDILFVTDNSGSMYQEQVKMADRFPGFIDSISNLDFRLAMITTDANDDKLLSFPSGRDFLSSNDQSLSTIKSDFINTVKRSETLSCDQTGTNCASGDERAIFTLNQTIDRSSSRSFFRGGAHLAVVILSDEDERTNGGQFTAFPLEPKDRPESLVSNVRAKFGGDKVMSVHSVIIEPGDQHCLNQQNAQTNSFGNLVRGYFGTQYDALSNPSDDLKATGNIIDGVTGSICSADYGQALGNIANKLTGIQFTKLPCSPKDGVITVTEEASGQPINFTLNGERIDYTNSVPAGVEVRLEFTCPFGS